MVAVPAAIDEHVQAQVPPSTGTSVPRNIANTVINNNLFILTYIQTLQKNQVHISYLFSFAFSIWCEIANVSKMHTFI
jgi:hypothetical protein